MPEFETKYFGRITYQPESVVEFPAGLPGFEKENRFLLIEQPINRPLVFLQSLTSSELCFVTVPVVLIEPAYQLNLNPEELELLNLETAPGGAAGPDLLCLAIISFHEDGPATANLLAPVVVNWRRRRGVQSVPADSPYSHRHVLLEPQEAPCL